MVVKKIVARAIKHIAKKSPIVKKSSRIRRKKHTPKYQDKKYSKKQLPTKAQANKIKKAQAALKERQEGIDGGRMIFGFFGIMSPNSQPGMNVVRNLPRYTKKQIAEKRQARLNAIMDEERKKAIVRKAAETEYEFWAGSPVVMDSLSAAEKELLRNKRNPAMQITPSVRGFQDFRHVYFKDKDGKIPRIGETFSSIYNYKDFVAIGRYLPTPFYKSKPLPPKNRFIPKAYRPKLSKLELEDQRKKYVFFKKIGIVDRGRRAKKYRIEREKEEGKR